MTKKQGIADRLTRRFYPGYRRGWDDRLLREQVLAYLVDDTRSMTHPVECHRHPAECHRHPAECHRLGRVQGDGRQTLLDLGAGRGNFLMDFRGQAKRACGIDPSPQVLANPYLDEGQVGTGEAIPYPDESFDVVVANNVLEHLADPAAALREVRRVLRPGGVFVAKTPNRWHYFAWAARLTPHRLHEWYYAWRGIKEDDPYPAFYRANSPAALRRLASEAGLEVAQLTPLEGCPVHLRWFWPAYLVGMAYERLVNAWGALAPLRAVLLVHLRKAGAAEGSDEVT